MKKIDENRSFILKHQIIKKFINTVIYKTTAGNINATSTTQGDGTSPPFSFLPLLKKIIVTVLNSNNIKYKKLEI